MFTLHNGQHDPIHSAGAKYSLVQKAAEVEKHDTLDIDGRGQSHSFDKGRTDTGCLTGIICVSSFLVIFASAAWSIGASNTSPLEESIVAVEVFSSTFESILPSGGLQGRTSQ